MTITLQKFVGHEFSPHLHFYTCGTTSVPSFHSDPSNDVGGVEKTNFDVTEGRNDRQSKH